LPGYASIPPASKQPLSGSNAGCSTLDFSSLRFVPPMQVLWAATLGRRTTKKHTEEQNNEDRARQTTHRTSSRQADSGSGNWKERTFESLLRNYEPMPPSPR